MRVHSQFYSTFRKIQAQLSQQRTVQIQWDCVLVFVFECRAQSQNTNHWKRNANLWNITFDAAYLVLEFWITVCESREVFLCLERGVNSLNKFHQREKVLREFSVWDEIEGRREDGSVEAETFKLMRVHNLECFNYWSLKKNLLVAKSEMQKRRKIWENYFILTHNIIEG